MISRKNFFSISLMMAVILLLFQFSEVVKENWNEYDINEFLTEEYAPLRSDSWSAKEQEDDYVVFVGEEASGKIAATVVQWCEYTKRKLYLYSSLESCIKDGKNSPEVLLLEGKYLTEEKDIESLQELNSLGIPLVFCSLPDFTVIMEQPAYMELLGVTSFYGPEKQISGIHLFSGFLLGGEVIYQAQDSKAAQQDFELAVAWYQLGSGTKAYMVGLYEGEETRNEELPTLIWRNNAGTASVFVVNGDYMEGNAGLGILQAMTAQIYSYALYPIVNAQNVTVANFPGLSSENKKEMREIYGVPQREVMRDIVWPGLAAMAEKSGTKPTYMMMPQWDYEDDNLPEEEMLVYYLKLIKEQKAEMGLSLMANEGIALDEKIRQDKAFLQNTEAQYTYGSFYGARDELFGATTWEEVLPNGIRTAVTSWSEHDKVFSYLTDSITLQSTTIDGYSHTFREDFRVRSLETALGYSNILIDMNKISWPANEMERWEILYEVFAGNTNTYWRAFQGFEQTAILESDSRIRNFLALDYVVSREGQCITLQVDAPNPSTWFLLRTHGEEIVSIEGGEFQRIEEGAWLIETNQAQVKINLQESSSLQIQP